MERAGAKQETAMGWRQGCVAGLCSAALWGCVAPDAYGPNGYDGAGYRYGGGPVYAPSGYSYPGPYAAPGVPYAAPGYEVGPAPVFGGVAVGFGGGDRNRWDRERGERERAFERDRGRAVPPGGFGRGPGAVPGPVAAPVPSGTPHPGPAGGAGLHPAAASPPAPRPHSDHPPRPGEHP